MSTYIFTDSDRKKSNQRAITEAIKKHFKKGTYPPNAWLRKVLIEYFELEYKCSNPNCGIVDWDGKPIILEVDHINGDNTDNRIENLRWLCPNCHSQTSNYKGRNINSGRLKVTDDELIDAYYSEGNIRRALIKVGLAPKGGNYSRMYKLLSAIQETE